MHKTASVVVTALSVLFASQAWAQFPNKPVTIVANVEPGSPIDATARFIKDKMEAALGQPVVIENRPGAGGITGTAAVARAAPDGYTVLVTGVGPMVTAPLLYKSTVTYDPVRDFEPINNILVVPCVFLVNEADPVKTIADLVKVAKSRPGKLKYATSGIGSPSHIAWEMFDVLFGTQLLHVPYKGAPQATLAVMTGEAELNYATMVVALPQIRAGKVRALAVTGSERVKAIPDVPTVGEIGHPDLTTPSWIAMFAPRNTPPDIVAKLNAAVQSALADPGTKNTIEQTQSVVLAQGPDELKKTLAAEIATWKKVIEERGIKGE